MVTNDSFYCYLVTIKLINCPCHHGADGLLEPTAVFCFVLSWRHNNVTLGIGTVWRMTTSFAEVQPPVAVKDSVLTPFLAKSYINLLIPIWNIHDQIIHYPIDINMRQPQLNHTYNILCHSSHNLSMLCTQVAFYALLNTYNNKKYIYNKRSIYII